jgi:hypothetical protein
LAKSDTGQQEEPAGGCCVRKKRIFLIRSEFSYKTQNVIKVYVCALLLVGLLIAVYFIGKHGPTRQAKNATLT